jgi:hypothetical protein
MYHSFTLHVAGISVAGDHYEDVLFEAGCDDALVGVAGGAIFLDFDREAPSFEEAVNSAVKNVEQAGGKVVKIEPIAAE